MRYFKLPDLGEGLQEAEVVEWFIKEGDRVSADQTIVSVETAKAIVELPSPVAATVARLCAQEGELLHIGEPLVEFISEADDDSGTVVGEMPTAEKPSDVEDNFIVGSTHALPPNTASISHFGDPRQNAASSGVESNTLRRKQAPMRYSQAVTGVRRSMARNMMSSHAEVVPVTLFDEVDIHAWSAKEDTTLRLILAMRDGVAAEPLMNAWFDGESMSAEVHKKIDLGIAVDTPDGLFVPVLRSIESRSAVDIKDGLEHLKADVASRSIPPQELMGATLMLSNYGTLAGKYGTPIVIPPCVCILGVGEIFTRLVDENGTIKSHRYLPLSLSFDHRAATGGEAARFLASVIKSLAKKKLKDKA